MNQKTETFFRRLSLASALAGSSLIVLTENWPKQWFGTPPTRPLLPEPLQSYSGGINFGEAAAIVGVSTYALAKLAGLQEYQARICGWSAGLLTFGLLVLNETTGFGGGVPVSADLILPAIFAINLAWLLPQYLQPIFHTKHNRRGEW